MLVVYVEEIEHFKYLGCLISADAMLRRKYQQELHISLRSVIN